MDNAVFESLRKQFAKIGADLRVVERTPITEWGVAQVRPFRANVEASGKTERFVFEVVPSALDSIQVVDLDGPGRHLLLNVQESGTRPGRKAEPQKLLMGHDEYHLFVAPVSRGAINVNAAKQSLKPAVVQDAQRRVKVKSRHLHKRKQAAFIRQGEWFFLPEPTLDADSKLILRNEPIRRGAGKPHRCEELYRTGGVTVHVCPQFPNGLTSKQHASLLQHTPLAKSYRWRVMTRDATVYARGKVSHPDHSTVHLQGWHRVVPNTETTSRFNAFLD